MALEDRNHPNAFTTSPREDLEEYGVWVKAGPEDLESDNGATQAAREDAGDQSSPTMQAGQGARSDTQGASPSEPDALDLDTSELDEVTPELGETFDDTVSDEFGDLQDVDPEDPLTQESAPATGDNSDSSAFGDAVVGQDREIPDVHKAQQSDQTEADPQDSEIRPGSHDLTEEEERLLADLEEEEGELPTFDDDAADAPVAPEEQDAASSTTDTTGEAKAFEDSELEELSLEEESPFDEDSSGLEDFELSLEEEEPGQQELLAGEEARSEDFLGKPSEQLAAGPEPSSTLPEEDAEPGESLASRDSQQLDSGQGEELESWDPGEMELEDSRQEDELWTEDSPDEDGTFDFGGTDDLSLDELQPDEEEVLTGDSAGETSGQGPQSVDTEMTDELGAQMPSEDALADEDSSFAAAEDEQTGMQQEPASEAAVEAAEEPAAAVESEEPGLRGPNSAEETPAGGGPTPAMTASSFDFDLPEAEADEELPDLEADEGELVLDDSQLTESTGRERVDEPEGTAAAEAAVTPDMGEDDEAPAELESLEALQPEDEEAEAEDEPSGLEPAPAQPGEKETAVGAPTESAGPAESGEPFDATEPAESGGATEEVFLDIEPHQEDEETPSAETYEESSREPSAGDPQDATLGRPSAESEPESEFDDVAAVTNEMLEPVEEEITLEDLGEVSDDWDEQREWDERATGAEQPPPEAAPSPEGIQLDEGPSSPHRSGPTEAAATEAVPGDAEKADFGAADLAAAADEAPPRDSQEPPASPQSAAATAPDADSVAQAVESVSQQILEKIEGELAGIKQDLSELRAQLSSMQWPSHSDSTESSDTTTEAPIGAISPETHPEYDAQSAEAAGDRLDPDQTLKSDTTDAPGESGDTLGWETGQPVEETPTPEAPPSAQEAPPTQETLSAQDTPSSQEPASGFFADADIEDEDETIALTGDELDHILNTADFTERPGEPTTPEEPETSESHEAQASAQTEDEVTSEPAAETQLSEQAGSDAPGPSFEDIEGPAQADSTDDIAIEELGDDDFSFDEEPRTGSPTSPEAISPESPERQEPEYSEQFGADDGETTATDPDADGTQDAPAQPADVTENAGGAAEAGAPDTDHGASGMEAWQGDEAQVDALAGMDIDSELSDIAELEEEPQPQEKQGLQEGREPREADAEIDLPSYDEDREEPYDRETPDHPESQAYAVTPEAPETEDSVEPTEPLAAAGEASETTDDEDWLGAEGQEAITAEQPEPAGVSDTQPGDTEGGAEEIPPHLREEIKSVLSYMDQLLESLPEEKIKEFARSEHFEVYKRLFEELGLEP